MGHYFFWLLHLDCKFKPEKKHSRHENGQYQLEGHVIKISYLHDSQQERSLRIFFCVRLSASSDCSII